MDFAEICILETTTQTGTWTSDLPSRPWTLLLNSHPAASDSSVPQFIQIHHIFRLPPLPFFRTPKLLPRPSVSCVPVVTRIARHRSSAFCRSSRVAVGSRPRKMGLANLRRNSDSSPKTPPLLSGATRCSKRERRGMGRNGSERWCKLK